MKFINQYTNKVYDTIEECEASEKKFLEKERGELETKTEAFLSCNTIRDAMVHYDSKMTAADRTLVLDHLKAAYPYSSVDEIANRMYSYESGEKRAFRYLWWYAKYPYIEQLIKADFLVTPIMRKMSGDWGNDGFDFGKCFHKGATLQEITGLKHFMIAYVKDIKEWSKYVETVKFLTKNAKGKEDCELWKSITERLNVTRIREAKYLLNNGYFTVRTLKNYLDRLDMYQAVGAYEGLMLTKRYVANCKKLKIEPVFDQPSIKRDVDVTNREVLKIADTILNEKLIKIMQGYKNLEYENEKFKVVVPKDNYDLVREGQENHNCVGGYGRWYIQNGIRKVLFVRRKSDPDTPYVTMDICNDTNGLKVCQYLAAFNRQPDNEALEFKKEYERFLSTIKN